MDNHLNPLRKWLSPTLSLSPDTRAGGGAPAMESRLSTLGVRTSLEAKLKKKTLPSFGDTALKTLPYKNG